MEVDSDPESKLNEDNSKLSMSRPVPQNPAHRSSNPRTPKGPPTLRRTSAHAPRLLRLTPTPPPANSNGPLANFGACPAATDTYPGLPKPREPPPLITTTSGQHAFSNDPSNISARHDLRSQLTPAHSVKPRQAPPPQPTYPEVLR
ncbi:hypothetical protein H2248_006360 [Termitomyces sp. 'cryptogamus']|nr:hypothetical protein H2248_006360 [Termitomyces sp. 'cryptogamus']